MDNEVKKISTEPYKGVRDFYPEDMDIQNYIFSVWRKTAEEFGYREYAASILEPMELYEAKSGSEIANEQTYNFHDRGDRRVALRPEMTPTLARMVAARRKSLKFPLRWFSVPNLFRYERPQRGRRREHWQLNCDLLGVADADAEIEIISLIYAVMKNFGAEDKDFEIRINNRKVINEALQQTGEVQEETISCVLRILDGWDKDESSPQALEEYLGKERASQFLNLLEENRSTEELQEILKSKGIKNVKLDTKLARGFDYYTGTVFEVFDTNPENRRALFGGGRYDNLMEIFGTEPIPAVGFGMGDITIRDFLETHGLLKN